MKVSFIIPALDEEAYILPCLEALQTFRRNGHEVILVDGGSTDRTVELAAPLVDRLIYSERGRACQMNAGAREASGEVFLFLHSDTIPAPDTDILLTHQVKSDLCWGRFDVRLSGSDPALRIIEFFMNHRSRWTGIATGDQGIFITRNLFRLCGGFPRIPIMEDVAMSKALLRHMRPLCLRERVVTSSRRWEQNGILNTIVTMWYLRLNYFLGVDPEKLAGKYD